MHAAILVSVLALGAEFAGHQDCGHGHAACANGYGFTQRACLNCRYGLPCSPTRPYNYRIAMDYPWSTPSYARAVAIMGAGPHYAQPMLQEPAEEVLIEGPADASTIGVPPQVQRSRARQTRTSPPQSRMKSIARLP